MIKIISEGMLELGDCVRLISNCKERKTGKYRVISIMNRGRKTEQVAFEPLFGNTKCLVTIISRRISTKSFWCSSIEKDKKRLPIEKKLDMPS